MFSIKNLSFFWITLRLGASRRNRFEGIAPGGAMVLGEGPRVKKWWIFLQNFGKFSQMGRMEVGGRFGAFCEVK